VILPNKLASQNLAVSDLCSVVIFFTFSALKTLPK
jgi:hypothetical protein